MIDEQEVIQEATQEETPDAIEQTVDHTPEPPKPDPAALYKRDIRNLRDKWEQSEREKSELIRLLQERQGNQQPDNFDFTLGDDDIVEGKHISKVKKQVKSELSKMQEELAAMKRQSNQLAAENKARSKYPDIDKVLSPENIEALKDADPDAARSIANLNDPYAQFTFAYLAIKEKVLNNPQPTYNRDKEQAQKNALKPKASAGMSSQQGDSPLAQANVFGAGLTPELKKKLREEMEQFARRV
jgi:hypothetical protein